VVLFTYLNPVLAYGAERFAEDSRGAGADGVLVLDLPPGEEPGWCSFIKGSGLDPIVLDSPNTSPARARDLAREADGFLYVISREGVTGTHAGAPGTLEERIATLRQITDLPLAVGFGVSTSRDVASIWKLAECAVVGSAFVDQLQRRSSRDRKDAAATFIRNLPHPPAAAQERLP
jgi:tryptophan synthase alpha chain